MSERFSFSSEGLAEAEAFDAYATLYAHGSDVARSAGAFRAEVRAWRMHGMIVFDRRLSGMTHSRSARVATDGFTHIVLHAVLSGHLLGSAASGFDVASPGEVVVMDTRQAAHTEPREAHIVTASIGRHVVEAASNDATALHGRILAPPDNLLLFDYLLSLTRNAGHIPQASMPATVRALVELLTTAMGSHHSPGPQSNRLTLLRRQSVERVIAARLADPGLNADHVADATGLSRSSLYRLIEGHGGLAALIRRRRLSAVRSALDNGSPASLAQLAEMFGFASDAHLGRLFAQAYGVSPGRYRRATATKAAAPAEDARQRWQGWMDDLA